MNGLQLASLAIASSIVAVFAALTMVVDRRRQRIRERLDLIRVSAGLSSSSSASRRRTNASPTAMLEIIGRTLAQSGLLPAATVAELRESLGNTVLAGPQGLGIFVGAKVMMAVGMLPVGFIVARETELTGFFRIIVPFAFFLTGLLAPDYLLRSARKRYVALVGRGLADALDMMVICAEAGLGLEPSIERVGVELVTAHPATAREFNLTSREFRMVADRRQVLINFAGRTGLPSLRRFATAMVQASQFGTPLSQALRTLATELRQETLTAYEARAARLPVLLTLPMILFILPCVFIIAAGPAVIQVMNTFVKR